MGINFLAHSFLPLRGVSPSFEFDFRVVPATTRSIEAVSEKLSVRNGEAGRPALLNSVITCRGSLRHA